MKILTKTILILAITLFAFSCSCSKENTKIDLINPPYGIEADLSIWDLEMLPNYEAKILRFEGKSDSTEIVVPAVFLNVYKIVYMNAHPLIERKVINYGRYKEINYTKSIYLKKLNEIVLCRNYKREDTLNYPILNWDKNVEFFNKATIPSHLDNQAIIKFAMDNGYTRTVDGSAVIYKI